VTAPAGPELVIFDRFGPGREEDDLRRRMLERGVRTEWVDWADVRLSVAPNRLIVGGAEMPLPRVAVLRSRVWTRHTAGDLAVLYDWLQALAELGVRLIPTVEALRTAKNKILSAARLHAAGVRVPPATTVHEVTEVGPLLDRWPEVMLKPVYGHSAVDVIRFRRQPSADPDIPGGLTSYQEILSWHQLESHGVLGVQAFVPNPGHDLRVLCVGTRIVSATRRIALSPTGEIKTTLYGYSEELADITPELSDLAGTAGRVLGLDYAAMDVLEGPDGLTVIEVNPTISSWCSADRDGMHQTPQGVGEEVAEMVHAAVTGRSGPVGPDRPAEPAPAAEPGSGPALVGGEGAGRWRGAP
jgi:tetrahydromethanopterin:alpha-L-glutamate ligase